MSDRVRITLERLGKTIEVERGSPLRSALLPFEVEFPCGGHGYCGGCRVRIVCGRRPPTAEETAVLTAGELSEGWRLACHCTVEGDATLEIGQWEAVILADQTSFAVTPRAGLGAAVDLGTTTIVAQLVDLSNGCTLATRTAINPQAVYGSDVISRIRAALEAGARERLAGEIRAEIGRLIAAVDSEGGLDTVVICGNTVMHHLFCGIDVEGLSRHPFDTGEGAQRGFRAGDLGWSLDGSAIIRFLPCIGGFVGSDILCGILATRMHESEEPVILVDLGTNGEVVVGNARRMLCASTAAGPAFEGGRIAMGMRASTGAIGEVTVTGGELRCSVMGGGDPRGICGSGVVAAVAAGLDLGLIEPNGRLAKGRRRLELMPRVALLQDDIRQVQLAKAAIAAGLRVLRDRFGREACRRAPVYLAGAFGNYVNRSSARRIGLLDCPGAEIRSAGNTALRGAKIVLCGADSTGEDFDRVRSLVEHVSLAADPGFQDIYVRELAFPEAGAGD